ncbi:MAG: hypothetical protein WCI27_09745 [Candidatus Omnitrophota bacterium]
MVKYILFSIISYYIFFPSAPIYAQETAVKKNLLTDTANNETSSSLEPKDIVPQPEIIIIRGGEDEATKKARLQLIKRKRIQELQKIKAFANEKRRLKRIEVAKIRAKEAETANERRKLFMLKRERENALKQLKRSQKKIRHRSRH